MVAILPIHPGEETSPGEGPGFLDVFQKAVNNEATMIEDDWGWLRMIKDRIFGLFFWTFDDAVFFLIFWVVH